MHQRIQKTPPTTQRPYYIYENK